MVRQEDSMKYAVLGLLLLSALFVASAAAAEEAPKAKQWWEIVGGILAIPAGVVSLAYSYVLIRKTRLEARKTELEIIEKESQLQELTAGRSEAAREIVAPLVQGRQAQYLMLRFVLLYVVLRLWNAITSAFNVLITGAALGAQQFAKINLDNNWLLVPFFVISKLPEVVDWLIILGLGLPLFRDLNKFLNIDLKAILVPWQRSK